MSHPNHLLPIVTRINALHRLSKSKREHQISLIILESTALKLRNPNVGLELSTLLYGELGSEVGARYTALLEEFSPTIKKGS